MTEQPRQRYLAVKVVMMPQIQILTGPYLVASFLVTSIRLAR
jgi:hypothetical protein